MTTEDEVRKKHRQQIKDEIKMLRSWLDYLERDIEHDNGIIHAILINSIAESCTKLIYNAGISNGAALSKA